MDCIRVFAILCVILTHATESTYTLNAQFLCNAERHVRWSGLALFTAGRLGVPLFFFLTGYLMLDRTYDAKQTLDLWKKKVLGLWTATEIWMVVYYFFTVSFFKVDFSVINLIRQVLFLNNSYGPHLWYMPVILGLYIFIPFVANGINRYDKRVFAFPVTLAVLYLLGVPTVNTLSRILFGRDLFYRTLDLSFAGGNYGILLILGWMVKKGTFRCVKNVWWLFLAIAGYVSTLALELYAYVRGVEYNVWYDCITLLIAGFAIFNLFLNIREIPCSKLVSKFSGGHLRYICAMILL